MIDYNPARKEIKAAKKCLQSMESSHDLDEMEQLWRDCINHIEKSHTKLLSATNPVKGKFSSFFSKKITQKKNDELLRYVNQARNTDNHSIADLSRKVPPSTRYSSLPGAKSHYIKHMVIGSYGQIEHYEGDPMLVKFHPASIEVISVTNSGVMYSPPNTHLGVPVASKSPIVLARKAISFFEDWIEDSSKNFI